MWNVKKKSKTDYTDILKIQFETLIIHPKNKLNCIELPSKQSHFIFAVPTNLKRCKFVQVKIQIVFPYRSTGKASSAYDCIGFLA